MNASNVWICIRSLICELWYQSSIFHHRYSFSPPTNMLRLLRPCSLRTAPRPAGGASNHGRGSAVSRSLRRQNVFGAALGRSEGETGRTGTTAAAAAAAGGGAGAGPGAGGQGRRRELTPPHSKSAPPSTSAATGCGRDGTSSSSACPGSLPLPPCMLRAMRFLLAGSASDAVGIFRKSGVRSRIQKLRDEIEADPGENEADGLHAVWSNVVLRISVVWRRDVYYSTRRHTQTCAFN